MFREIRSGAREDTLFGIRLGCWTIIVFVLLVAVILGLLALNPTFRNLWIKGFRSSNEYVTTKEGVLFKLMQSYEKLDAEIAEFQQAEGNESVIEAKRGQQQAILDRMEQEVSVMQSDQVPSKIRSFLAKNGR